MRTWVFAALCFVSYIVPRYSIEAFALGEATVKRAASNSTSFGTPLWVDDVSYEGATFFDEWDFWAYPDPTHGQVEYVNRSVALNKLAYVTNDNRAMMQVDTWTRLAPGQNRQSVRIHSKKAYDGGLFVLDVERAPFGCGVWPAFWLCGENWPGDGEIDIIEGVHSSSNNQVAWHTSPGCKLTIPGNFSGEITPNTDCDAAINYNSGCAIRDTSRSSYGDQFKDYGGGVYVTKWDENSMDVWFFYRATVPKDIRNGTPDPDQWGPPSASLSATNCNPLSKYFKKLKIIFNITLCGDWAGSSFSAVGCPGSCPDYILDPNHLQDAYWSINSLKVYRKTQLSGRVVNGANRRLPVRVLWVLIPLLVLFGWN